MIFVSLTDLDGNRVQVNAGNIAYYTQDRPRKGSLIAFSVAGAGGFATLAVAETPEGDRHPDQRQAAQVTGRRALAGLPPPFRRHRARRLKARFTPPPQYGIPLMPRRSIRDMPCD